MDPKTRRYLTTHQVAEMLGLSLPTVVNYVNAGRIMAHRTPGGHRRIAPEHLRRFCLDHNVPIPPEMEEREASDTHRVLVVDDEADFADMVKTYLELRGGMEVAVADSGFAAGLLVGRFVPDLILMDILMPDADGFEALRSLRSLPDTRDIPIVACTGVATPDIDDRIRQAGFSGHLRKPVALDALLAEVRRLLKSGRFGQVAEAPAYAYR